MADTEFVKKDDVVAIIAECQAKIDDPKDQDLYSSPESDEGAHEAASYILNRVNDLFAAAVSAVRYSEWVEKDGVFECRKCGYSFDHEGYIHFFDFCPCCGAKMGRKQNQREESE